MKSLPPSKINSTKLLGGSSFSTKKTSVSLNKLKTSGENDFSIIKKQVFQIKNLVTNITLSKKNEEKRKQKEQEKEKFEGTEKNLEKKKPKETGIKLPSTPKLGFLDRIKNFLFNTFLGFIAVRLIEHLPKLIGVAKFLGGTLDFLTSVGGTLLNGLVTFVEKGYEVADFTRKQLRNFGGEGAVEKFDALNKAFENIIFAAIAASLALGNLGSGGEKGGGPGGKPARRGFDTTGRRVGVNTQKRFAEKYGRDEFIKRFGKDNLKNLPKSMQRSALTKFGRNAVVGALGKGGTKTALKIVAPLVRNIPLIGGVMEFVLSWMSGDPVGKAAFKGVGAGLGTWIGGALGSLIPIPGVGTAIGMWLGSAGGSKLAEVIYDKIFNSKDSPQKPQESIKAAGGGSAPSTRGGRIVTGPAKRKITKARRTVKVQSTPIKPGASIGGEKQIEKVFPKGEKSGTVNPLGYIEDTYKKTSEAPYFGALMGIATKAVVGQKASPIDYKNAAQGLSNWMNVTFSDEVLRTGALAAAGGGQINAEMLSKSGGDMTNIIAKSLEENISKKVDDAINDLMKQMMLKPTETEKESKESTTPTDDLPGGGLTPGQWGPMLDLISSGEGGYTSVNPSLVRPGITDMNLQQLLSFKAQSKRTHGGSAALGRYQFINPELAYSLGGINPNEKFTPANQDKMAVGYLEKKRPGKEWLAGKMTTRQYIEELSNEWGAFRSYSGNVLPGNSGKIGPEKIEAALNKVKKGGYSQQELSMSTSGGALGAGYGSGGSKIAGDLGDYMKQVKIPTGSIHQHPRHLPMERRGYKSYHNEGRAIDLGGYGPAHPSSGGRDEQAPILRALIQWNKQRGVTPVQVIHGSPAFRGFGKYESGPNDLHSHHVHVAYFKGGFVKKTGLHMLHQGEFVVDKDSVDLLGKDFIATINSIENTSQLKNKADTLINTISHIAGYEPGGQQEVLVEQPEPEIVYITTPVPIGGGAMVMGGSSGGSNFSEGLYERG
jgi:hypothetical protein